MIRLAGCECKIVRNETGQRIEYCIIHDAAFQLFVAIRSLRQAAPDFVEWLNTLIKTADDMIRKDDAEVKEPKR